MNFDLIILSITFLIAFYLHTRLVAKATGAAAPHNAEANLGGSDDRDLTIFEGQIENASTFSAEKAAKKEETVDFDNLVTASDDALLREMALIENRQEKPKTMSVVERKQRLTYELKKRKIPLATS